MRCLNVMANPDLVRKYAIMSVPTFVYVRDGQEVRRSRSCRTEWQMRRLCRDSWL